MTDRRYTPTYRYGAPGGTPDDDRDVRSGIYGSFLSGGFAGHIYGAEGIWGADTEPGSSPFMWQAFQWNSANHDAISQNLRVLRGHAAIRIWFPTRTSSRRARRIRDQRLYRLGVLRPHAGTRFFLAYFEKNYPKGGMIRGALPRSDYRAEWFDPHTGQWSPAGGGVLHANVWGWIHLPDFPSNDDWGLKLILVK